MEVGECVVKWVSTPELEEMRGTHDRIVLGENCSCWAVVNIIPRFVSMTPFIHLLIYFLHSQIKHRFAWLEFGDLRVVVMKQKHEIRQWSRCHVKTLAELAGWRLSRSWHYQQKAFSFIRWATNTDLTWSWSGFLPIIAWTNSRAIKIVKSVAICKSIYDLSLVPAATHWDSSSSLDTFVLFVFGWKQHSI